MVASLLEMYECGKTDTDLLIQGECNILGSRHFKTKESQTKLVCAMSDGACYNFEKRLAY